MQLIVKYYKRNGADNMKKTEPWRCQDKVWDKLFIVKNMNEQYLNKSKMFSLFTVETRQI